MTGFNLSFDEADGKELILILQKSQGCFACQKPDPRKTCSKCKVAKYCSKECQRKDWKREHKEICGVWCDNRGSGNTDVDEWSACIPVCMRSCGFLPEDLFSNEMKRRGDLFFNEVTNCGIDVLNFQVAVIDSVGAIRLCAAASFWSDSDSRVLVVNHVLFETVDEGEEAKRRLYPPYGGSGEISNKAKKLVVEKLTDFVKRMDEFGIHVNGITCGRGLMWLSDEDDAKEAQVTIEEHNGEVNGVHRRIMWMPSMDYAVEDSMTTAMKAAMPDLAGMMGMFGNM